MWKKSLVLSVIPARGGSVGIKNKNLKEVAGKSLIRHAIDKSKDSKIIDTTVITSDSNEILNEASKIGIDLCIKRPDNLSDSYASSVDTWIHAWEHVERLTSKSFEYSVLIQPTSPNRSIKELNDCFNTLERRKYGLVTTISKVPSHFNPEKILIKINDDYHFANKEGPLSNNRHQLPSYFFRNGNYYITRKKHLINDKLFLESNCGFHLSENEAINIDEEIDLKIANILMADSNNIN